MFILLQEFASSFKYRWPAGVKGQPEPKDKMKVDVAWKFTDNCIKKYIKI